MRNKKLIVGNWKMFPETEKEAKEIAKKIKVAAGKLARVETVICPPSIYLDSLKSASSSDRFAIGAQNLAVSNEEEQTGELGSEMLRNVGATYVILGHSERRHTGETDEMVAMKVLVAAKSGFRIVLCFGEEMRDEEGAYLDVLKKQLIARLALVPRGNLDRVTLAYEPIWAIGKNATGKETPDDLHQISIFARKTLIELFGKPSADKVAFLYGGSVDETNAASFVTEGMADGLLVGRASRDVSRFTSILHAVSTAS